MSESDVNQDNVSNESAETEANAVDETEATDLETRLAEAQARAEENWDQALRVKAEMENMRRRAERDVENAHKYALERFTQELLPVIDSLEMGTHAAMAEGATLEKLQEGTELTLKMLLSVIDKFGIQAVHPEGEPFDPELHQAMSMLESPEHAPNTVMNVMQKGYLLNERLIRPAMVVVSKASTKSEDDA
ncbi:MAG: nucleotide exchange factor GrpE [Gammaproteobacteria bacterium]|nr:nucleotide exchange factor GrpE [Gammaproteobacteria bacterium]